MMSSANREKWHMSSEAHEESSTTKSRSETESRELAVGLRKPRDWTCEEGRVLSSQGHGASCSATAWTVPDKGAA